MFHSILLGLVVLFWLSSPGAALDPCGEGKLQQVTVQQDLLFIQWSGEIANGIAQQIENAFDAHREEVRSVALSLHSCGGERADMEATIAVLERIKLTHKFSTMVGRGRTCGSACVFVFLAGHRRVAALTSVWLFHLAWYFEPQGGIDGALMPTSSVKSTDEVLDRYAVPAGVSKKWLVRLRRIIKKHDYWQTGRDLWETKSGVITDRMDNEEPRNEAPFYLSPNAVCGGFCRG